MTRRINQKLAVKRRKEEQEEELKAAKKAKKAEKKKVEAEAKVNSGQKVIVDRLVAGGEEALRAHTLLASGEEVNVELFSTGSDALSAPYINIIFRWFWRSFTQLEEKHHMFCTFLILVRPKRRQMRCVNIFHKNCSKSGLGCCCFSLC